MTTLTEKLAPILAKMDTIISGTADYSVVTAKIDITNTRLNTLLTLVGAQNRTIEAILAAIGTLEGDPANYTVKELLAMLQTSVDTAPSEKTGQNVPPSSAFACGPWLRQHGWLNAGWIGSIGTGMDHWTPDFSGTVQVGASLYTIESQPNSDHTRFLYRAIDQNGTSASVCIGWNVTAHETPSLVRCLNYEIASNNPDNWFYPLSQIVSTPVIYPQEGILPAIDAISFETRTQTPNIIMIGDIVFECLVGFDGIAPLYPDFFISVNPTA
jgi:hypothetical protein